MNLNRTKKLKQKSNNSLVIIFNAKIFTFTQACKHFVKKKKHRIYNRQFKTLLILLYLYFRERESECHENDPQWQRRKRRM